MTPEQFAAFYEAVHGYNPFPWQQRLARQVAEGVWPSVLALPTASGKTSALDVAVFHLALEAGKSLSDRVAPIRIFFVIDRRLVVDQAAEHARELKSKLDNPGKVQILKEVAQALLRYGGQSPLQVAQMRGGMYRDEAWTKSPNQPTIVVSTVDQVGSRLLFRGYGISEYGRPIHAGLTGNDALYLLDEAHLSAPFLKTLRTVKQFRQAPWAEFPVGGPFHVVEISATPSNDAVPFTLSDDDLANPELSRRLQASKPATLLEPAKFETEAVKVALKVRQENVKVIGIVVNRVASARDIFSLLPGEPFLDKVLLTGRIRPWDRDQLLARCLDRLRAGRERLPDDRPIFVVATMTVEVGADLDFDYLVTEAASLSALRQRFGRLDRLGRFGHGAGAILLRKQKDIDPIYGEELALTWTWLCNIARDGIVDFGINAFSERLRQAQEPPPPATVRHCPTLFPAHFDSWVQTSPTPEPTPDVAPFLHGMEALDTADVQLVWREDLISTREEDWLDIVAIAPPRSREALGLPIYAVRNWLNQIGGPDVGDIEGTPTQDAQEKGSDRPVLRWLGPDADESRVISPEEIRPGDTLVVPAEYGGADVFGWSPKLAEPVRDVGDLCVNEMANGAPQDGLSRLIRLRLYPGFERHLVPESEESESTPSVTALVKRLQALLITGDDYQEDLNVLLTSLATRPPVDPLLAATAKQFIKANPQLKAYPMGVVLTTRVRSGFYQPLVEVKDAVESDDGTDTDDSSSLRGGTYRPVAVTLDDHLAGVASWTKSFLGGLRLDGDLGLALISAARFHDIGKADQRFQALLYGDEPSEPLLAKSGKDLEPTRNRFGLPRGFRHEMVSVAIVRKHQEELLADLNKDNKSLVEYLIGTHHGRGRPFVPVINEKNPEPVTLSVAGIPLSGNPDHRYWRLDSGWTDNFWTMVRRFGYWGLAYLETVLRLADASRSFEEQHQ